MPNSLWLITDGKPGHEAQLRGLGGRLSTLTQVEPFWVGAQQYRLPWWRLQARAPSGAPTPALMVGAGRTSHRLLLALSRRYQVPAVVLMRPAYPLSLFDAAIIPAHDQPPKRDHVLVTEGVLNDLHPLERLTDEKSGLILAGGPSRHYHWQQQRLREQIQAIVRQRPDWHWHLSDSRRTPETFLQEFNQGESASLHLHPFAETPPGWVRQRLGQSRTVWVTPDSVSMVFEALTAGVPTGLLSLPVRRKGRVPNAMQGLIETGRVTTWPEAPDAHTTLPVLWEADRAARWLMGRFPEHLPLREPI